MKQQDTDFIAVTRLRGAIEASTRFLHNESSIRTDKAIGKILDALVDRTDSIKRNSDTNWADIKDWVQLIEHRQAKDSEALQAVARLADSINVNTTLLAVFMTINIAIQLAVLIHFCW